MKVKKSDKYFIMNRRVKDVIEHYMHHDVKGSNYITPFADSIGYQVTPFKKVMGNQTLINSSALYELVHQHNINPAYLFNKSDKMFNDDPDLTPQLDDLQAKNKALETELKMLKFTLKLLAEKHNENIDI